MTDVPRRPLHRRFRIAVVALLLAGLVVACALDMPVYRWLRVARPQWVNKDPGHLLRIGGYLPTWFLIGAALVLHDRARMGRWSLEACRRGSMLITSACAAGLVAETVKLIVRRQRPESADIWYGFRPLWDRPFFNGGLSMPSSHVMVAFGACFVLAWLFPAARWVFFAFAAGTALSRIASNAHYASDTYVAAVLAWPVACWSIHVFGRDERPRLTGAA